MQLIINIPEEIYDSACATNNIWDMRMAGFVCSAIANGTPLDDVKKEILRGHIEADLMYVGRIIEILDNIGKAESEDKE